MSKESPSVLDVFLEGVLHTNQAKDVIMTFLSRMGFLNVYRPIIYGPWERAKFPEGMSFSNVLLNTNCGEITIEEGVIMGHGVMFLTGRHYFKDGQVIPWDTQKTKFGYDIIIRKGCWIATNAIIVGGTELGEGCLVRAGSIVTRSFPAGTILSGIPAKAVGHVSELISDEEDSERIIALAKKKEADDKAKAKAAVYKFSFPCPPKYFSTKSPAKKKSVLKKNKKLKRKR